MSCIYAGYQTTPYLQYANTGCNLLNYRPEWSTAVNIARKLVGSLQIDGEHQGCVLFIDQNTALVPYHVIDPGQTVAGKALNNYLERLSIYFYDNDFCYLRKITQILEHSAENDFCILKLDQNIPVPSLTINYSNPSTALFVQMNAEGILEMSLVETCAPLFWESGYCAYTPTCQGSSGGCYFDISGAWIAMHVSKSTGLCGTDTGAERKGILAKDLERMSTIIQASTQHFCPDPAYLNLHPILYTTRSEDICYTQEKKAVKGSFDQNNYHIEYNEIFSGVQRSIKITIKNQNNTKEIMTHEYALRLVENAYKQNIHKSNAYVGSEPSFYCAIASAIFNAYFPLKQTPDTLSIKYKKSEIVAERTDRHIFSTQSKR